MAEADRVIEARIDRIASSIRGRAQQSKLSEEAFTQQLRVETEVSLRASSPDWCPQHCVDAEGYPQICDHGEPLTEEQRHKWVRSHIGGARG